MNNVYLCCVRFQNNLLYTGETAIVRTKFYQNCVKRVPTISYRPNATVPHMHFTSNCRKSDIVGEMFH